MKFILPLLLSTISTFVICANLTKFPLQEGPLLGRSLDCRDVDECEDINPAYDSKICGTNGKTFNSLCDFMRAHCKEGTVNFKSYGECSASEKCLGERRTALNKAKARKGVFIPECNPDGTFKSVQCHKDTGYCWCSSPLGQAVIGTDTHNTVPDCQNLTTKPAESSSTLRPPIWYKGIAPNEGPLIINPDIDSTTNSSRSNRESTDLTSIEGEVDPESSSEEKKKQSKRPRGCEGKRRSSFNKNMLKNMVEEFGRENEVTALSGDRVLERASLQWKFDELNTRKDNQLRRAEYKGIQKIIRRSFKPRKCAKKFPKFCDKNADKNISLDEWINCFTSGEDQNEVFVKEKPYKTIKGTKGTIATHTGKGPVKRKRPCDYEQKQAVDSGNPDAYVPKCDDDGFFRPIQCYGSNITNSWYCFCVNVLSGDMIENTSMRYGTPNCSVSWPNCPPPDKEEKFLKALRSYFVKYVKEKIFKKQDAKATMISDEKVLETIFKFIDKNGDNFIEKKERRRLKKLIPKKDKRIWTCGRKIHIVCDMSGDKKISLQEFLNCISLRKNNHTVNESFEKKPAPSETRRRKSNPFIEVIKSE